FPDVLEQERQNDLARLDDGTYAWIWEGAYLTNSEKQVLHGKYLVREFEPTKEFQGPYFGVDWGFSSDPTAGSKSWIYDGELFVEHDCSKIQLELDDTPGYLMRHLPEIQTHVSRADNARPETIRYCKNHGLPRIQAAKKWPGSVEDGISHLRSYKN